MEEKGERQTDRLNFQTAHIQSSSKVTMPALTHLGGKQERNSGHSSHGRSDVSSVNNTHRRGIRSMLATPHPPLQVTECIYLRGTRYTKSWPSLGHCPEPSRVNKAKAVMVISP